MIWKKENGVWVSGLYKITPMRHFCKLFFDEKWIGNFQTLDDAKDSISD